MIATWILGCVLLFLVREAAAGTYSNWTELRPERRKCDNIYEVPFMFKGVPAETQKQFHWASRYLARGSNLLFVEVQDMADDVVVVEFDGDCCYRRNSISIAPACHSLRDILRQLLFAAGMAFEDARRERTNFFANADARGLDDRDPWRQQDPFLLKPTPYDLASLTHGKLVPPPRRRRVWDLPELRDPSLKDIVSGDRILLSSCDWATLHAMYPGAKEPPACLPGLVPDLLVPTDAFRRRVGDSRARWVCRYDHLQAFNNRECVFEDGAEYPPVPWANEVTEVPASTVPVPRLKKYCKPYESFDYAASSAAAPINCTEVCVVRCPKEYPTMRIHDCMKFRFTPCVVDRARHARRRRHASSRRRP